VISLVENNKGPKKVKIKKFVKKSELRKKRPKTVVVEDKSNTWVWITVVIILLAIIAIVAILLFVPQVGVDGGQITGATVASEKVVAIVNADPVYESELEELYARLPPNVRSFMTKDQVLEQIIDERLLVQEADEQGIKVTDKELDELLQRMLDTNFITIEQLEEQLTAQDLTLEEFMELNKRQLLIVRLINQSVYSNIEVTEDEIEEYYEQNTGLFFVPESVTVRHILIGLEERENEEARELSHNLLTELEEDNELFCDYVTNYSEDPGSIANCGEYTFTIQDSFVPEFKDLAFELEDGEFGVAETVFGYHIMHRISGEPQRTLDIDEARDDIEVLLIQDKSNTAYQEFLQELRDKAIIELYPEEEVVEEEEPPFEIIIEEEPVEEVVEEEEPEVKKVVVKTTLSTMDDFAKCLSDAGATMFGVYWSPHTTQQKDIFGLSFEFIEYVECDSEGENAQPERCENAGITTYPTWIIDEDEYKGLQSLSVLGMKSGCEVPE
jgi:parvulin-like peptidyl-prolyl isomerase